MSQTMIAPGQDMRGIHKAFTLPEVHPWRALLDTGKSVLILPPAGVDVSAAIQAVAQGPDMSLRVMGRKDEVLGACAQQLPVSLKDYISSLLDDYEAFMDASILRVRLETVRSRACWKWHQDYTTLRLITTLRGAGTQYLPDPAQPDMIAHCKEGEIGLFKGRLFGEYFDLSGHTACVHRSPPWDDSSDPRLLLVIDMPQDFEIEHA